MVDGGGVDSSVLGESAARHAESFESNLEFVACHGAITRASSPMAIIQNWAARPMAASMSTAAPIPRHTTGSGQRRRRRHDGRYVVRWNGPMDRAAFLAGSGLELHRVACGAILIYGLIAWCKRLS